MSHNEDDVFVWYFGWDYTWTYRKDADTVVAELGNPNDVFTAESPEWVAHMEMFA